jgi:hypothetical protein
MNDLDRLSGDNYLPTEQDILQLRIQTTGIVEYALQFEQITFKLRPTDW